MGNDAETTWANLLKGVSGAGPITLFDATDFPVRFACEVKDFDAEQWLDRKDARRMDRFLAFATASAKQAIDDSGLQITDENRDEIGVLFGSGIGGLSMVQTNIRKLQNEGVDRVSPFLVPYMIPDMASGIVSIQHGARGPNTCVVTACSTGANAIGDAYHLIKRGDAIAMIAGGVEAPINEIGVAGFASSKALSTRNDDYKTASRPFDATRDGFVIGEGAGAMILEDYDYAKARGAKIYGEILGYSMTGDAFHITQPDPEGSGATRAMQRALRSARIEPEQIDYINAHGTSTPYNDRIETLAIKNAFGEAAKRVPVSSTKSMTGHALGAAGSIESIFCLLVIANNVIPPTINLHEPDPECDLDYVPNEAREVTVKYALSNSFGFGGHNVCLVFGPG